MTRKIVFAVSLVGSLCIVGCGGSGGGGNTQPPPKTTPTVSAWPTPSAITYGQTLASSTLTGGTASTSGTFAWTIPSTALTAGAWPESVTFTPSDSTDYNTAAGSVAVTVNQAVPTVSAWPAASAITSGQALSSSTLTGGTASVPGEFAWTTPDTVPAAGTDPEGVIFTPTDATDYMAVTGSIPIVVNPTTPQITSYTPRYAVEDSFSNAGVPYTVTCEGCLAGDILHDATGIFGDLTIPTTETTLNFSDVWNGLDYEPLFDTVEIQHPNGPYGNQYSTAFLGSASQSTLAVSETTGTLFQVEQKSGQVDYVTTSGTTGALLSGVSGAQSPNLIAADDATGDIAYAITGKTNQIDVYDEKGNLTCYLNTSMSSFSSIAAGGGTMVFTDPTDNKVGIAKMDCSGYVPISVPGQPWSVAISNGSAYVLSRDKGADGVPTVTTINISTAKATTVDLPGITPVSTIRATDPYEGVYTIVAFNQTPTVDVLFMSDQTDGTVLLLNTGTVGGAATKIAFTVHVPELPYILAMQDGSSTPLCLWDTSLPQVARR